jgi:hypothetical protein
MNTELWATATAALQIARLGIVCRRRNTGQIARQMKPELPVRGEEEITLSA